MNTLSAKLQELAAVRKVLQDKAGRLEKEKEKLKAETEFTKKVQALMQECGNLTLSMISMKISDIVTRAIKSIFPDPYEFQLEFDIKYGRLSAQMVLLRDKQVYYPADDNGDGVLDIIALALRTAVLCMDKRNLRRVMILDEPCGALSVDMQPLAGKLLRHLHESLGIQFIIVGAHGNAYREYADKEIDSESFSVPGTVL